MDENGRGFRLDAVAGAPWAGLFVSILFLIGLGWVAFVDLALTPFGR